MFVQGILVKQVVLGRGQQDGSLVFKERQLEHVDKQQDASHHGKDQSFIDELHLGQGDNHCQDDKEDDGHGKGRETRHGLVFAVHARLLLGFEALGDYQKHHCCHKDTHDDQQENVRPRPLIRAEEIKRSTFIVAPHTVLVDPLTHIPVTHIVVVIVQGTFRLDLVVFRPELVVISL